MACCWRPDRAAAGTATIPGGAGGRVPVAIGMGASTPTGGCCAAIDCSGGGARGRVITQPAGEAVH